MEKYKATLTVPTEPYGNMYVEVEGTPEEIYETYKKFRHTIDGGEGLTNKEMNYIDKYAEKIVLVDTEDFERFGYKLSKKLLEDALKQM